MNQHAHISRDAPCAPARGPPETTNNTSRNNSSYCAAEQKKNREEERIEEARGRSAKIERRTSRAKSNRGVHLFIHSFIQSHLTFTQQTCNVLLNLQHFPFCTCSFEESLRGETVSVVKFKITFHFKLLLINGNAVRRRTSGQMCNIVYIVLRTVCRPSAPFDVKVF